MKKRKIRIVMLWRILFVAFLLLLSGSIFILLATGLLNDHVKRIEGVRQDYVNHQKRMIEAEVNHAVNLVRYGLSLRNQIDAPGEATLKNEMIHKLADIRFGPDKKGYLFGSTFSGDPLFTNGKVTMGSGNIWNQTDPNGVKIIQKQRKLAEKPNGGFYYYSWRKLNQRTPSPKVSFTKGIPEWQWMIGAGVYIDDIETNVATLQAELARNMKSHLRDALIITFLIVLLFLCLERIINRYLERDFSLIINFFKQFQNSEREIERSEIKFEEFDTMADFANTMLEEKIRNEQELLKAKKLESIALLAGGIAHDFNNMLTGIYGNIALAKRRLAPDHKACEYIDTTEKSIESATNLTQQLLTFARGGEPVKEDINIAETIKSAAEFTLRGGNIKLDVDIANDLGFVHADKGQINQVISNLVINARQAMPGGGTLKVSADNLENTGQINLLAQGHYVVIRIQDQGIGIPPEHIEKVFDPYFSLKESGNGLGLAIVHSIISKHDGYITAESEPNQGTSFTIYLPSVIAPNENEPPKPETLSKELPKNVRILVMDDEEIIRELIAEMIEFMGFEIALAVDGKDALTQYQQALVDKKPFTIVIVDLTVPGGMGGLEATERILKIDPKAKVIVSSGYSNNPVMADFKTYGFKACILKPYSLKDFEKRILTVLNAE